MRLKGLINFKPLVKNKFYWFFSKLIWKKEITNSISRQKNLIYSCVVKIRTSYKNYWRIFNFCYNLLLQNHFFFKCISCWRNFGNILPLENEKRSLASSDWLLLNRASHLLSSSVFIGLSRVYELFWLVALAFQCVMSAKRLLNWRNEVCAAMELSLLMGAKLVRDLMFDVLSWIIHMNLMNGIR